MLSVSDTHTHLYARDFSGDLDVLLQKAIHQGVTRFFLPNIDWESLPGLFELVEKYPAHCFPMAGIHPTSVNTESLEELQKIQEWVAGKPLVAIGEIGMDLYWDKTYQAEQEDLFIRQVEWANELKLPVVIHSRESIDLLCAILETRVKAILPGVFHCFTGTPEQAQRILDLGFYLGIGGVLTYKNSTLKDFIGTLPEERIVLETDAPYLPPVPHRGKRNEPSYILYVLEKLAEVTGKSSLHWARVTTENTNRLFQL